MSEPASGTAPTKEAASNANDDNDDKNTAPEDEKKPCYCSMCWRGDSEDNAGRLLKCRECGVFYHNFCYRGIEDDDDDDDNSDDNDEICLACDAIGTTVTGRTSSGTHHTIEITARPFECCLCSVHNPELPLAMHPIYDRNRGRQLVLESHPHAESNRRLAWCHTLCARVISAYKPTGGCVYSCDREGFYGGHEADDQDRSIGSGIQQARDHLDEVTDDGVHHHVIVIAPQYDSYIDAIKTHQKFECKVCFKKDTPAHIFRIPIPCMCREPQEPKKYSACHQKRDLECLNGMHVGCAFWGKHVNGKQHWPTMRRVYFEPKDEGDFCLLYCDRHAKNLKKTGPKKGIVGSDWMRYPDIENAQVGDDKVVDVANLPIEDADDAIQIDNDAEFVEFEGDAESSDDDLDDDVEDLDDDDLDVDGQDEDDTDEGGTDGQDNESSRETEERRKKRKRKRKKKKKKKRRKDVSVLEKAGKSPPTHRHEETAKERLEKRMAKRTKQSSGSGGGGGGGNGPSSTIGDKRQTSYKEVRPTRVNKASLLTTATTGNEEFENQEDVASAAKKEKKPPRKLTSYIGSIQNPKAANPCHGGWHVNDTNGAPKSAGGQTKELGSKGVAPASSNAIKSVPPRYSGPTAKNAPAPKSILKKPKQRKASGSDSEDVFVSGGVFTGTPSSKPDKKGGLSDGEVSEDLFSPGTL